MAESDEENSSSSRFIACNKTPIPGKKALLDIDKFHFFLTFMAPCIVSIFYYISNKMKRYTVYLYLETALYVSGGTTTHQQERKHLYLQHLVLVTPLLLPAATACKLSANLYDIYHCCVYSEKTPDDGQRNFPKHVEFHSKNKSRN